jgi:hypothetical protein
MMMMTWIKSNELLLGWLTLASVILFIGTLAAVPWLIARIPPDYFAHDRRHKAPWAGKRPLRRLLLLIGKNLLGCLAILAGVAMLVLPGQGLLAILLGIMLLDFPGKYKMERRIVSWKPVLRTINRLRRRSGREPLKM